MSCRVGPRRVVSRLVVSRRIASCRVASRRVVLCRVVVCVVVFWFVMSPVVVVSCRLSLRCCASPGRCAMPCVVACACD
eukprot:6095511-Lingulodinium_polyedra.AAC.1